MVVSEEIKKCTVFIGYNSKDNRLIIGGTAFFVGVPVEGNDSLFFPYLVTTKHNINKIKCESCDGKVIIRVNTPDNTYANVESKIDNWKFHPTDVSVDVAVLQCRGLEKLDVLTIPRNRLALTDEIIKEKRIGMGDEVFLVGLFRYHYGSKRNLPIIRTGNIALMPIEKVYTSGFGLIDAYLIEIRSIGGLSGSPVFVNTGTIRPLNDDFSHYGIQESATIFYWLGMVQGHVNIKENKIDTAEDEDQKDINMGICIVIPTSKILEIIDSEELVEFRKQETNKMKLKDQTK